FTTPSALRTVRVFSVLYFIRISLSNAVTSDTLAAEPVQAVVHDDKYIIFNVYQYQRPLGDVQRELCQFGAYRIEENSVNRNIKHVATCLLKRIGDSHDTLGGMQRLIGMPC